MSEIQILFGETLHLVQDDRTFCKAPLPSRYFFGPLERNIWWLEDERMCKTCKRIYAKRDGVVRT